MFENMSLGKKLISGFIGVALVVLVVGLVGYMSAKNMEETTNEIIEAAPLTDAAMEMKLSVATDQQLVMELIAATSLKDLEDNWRAHEEQVKWYDTYSDAILSGAETSEGTIYAAKNDKLRGIVRQADEFHNNQLQPAIKKVRDLRAEELGLQKDAESTMRELEKTYDDMVELAEGFESRVKDRIASLAEKGVSAEKIMKKENTWADMAMEIKTTLAESRIVIEESAQSFEAGHLEDFVNEYKEHQDTFDGWIRALLRGGSTEEGMIAAVDVSELRSMVIDMDKMHNQNFNVAAEGFLAIQGQLADVTTAIGESDVTADAIASRMKDMLGGVEEGAKREIEAATESAHAIASAALKMILGGVIIAFILAIALGAFITSSITRPINEVIAGLDEGSDQVASASQQISSSSQSLSEGATEQAASLEETSSSLEEMGATIQQNADNAAEAKQLAVVAKDTANKGAGSIKKMITSVNEINKSSDEVSKIIKVIDEIAFQTNLLALNAAVEAARAGEHGKGFAVVAEEVRNLAGRSAEAAKNTADLIEKSAVAAKEGSSLAEESGAVLEEIVTNSTKVADLVAEIAGASREQAEGISQVTKAIAQMDQVTQQNSAVSEESASASEELASQGAGLKDMVSNLVDIIGGGGGKRTSTGTAARVAKPGALKTKSFDVHKILAQTKAKSHLAGASQTAGKRVAVNPKDVIPLNEEEFSEF